MRLFLFIIAFLLQTFTCPAQNSLTFISATTGAACQEVENYGDYLITGNGTTLAIYDVSPSQTVPFNQIYQYRYRSRINDLQIRDHLLYVAANHDGVSKWDISQPENPVLLAEYIPDNTEEVAYDISFFGDSLFIAAGKKVVILNDSENQFLKIGEFHEFTGNGIICGGAVKDDLYAFVLGLGWRNDGVYLYDARTLNQISSFPQTFADPEDVIFGKSTQLLHVLGGTQSTTNPFSPSGYFYSLDISDPSSPQIVFADTIKGITGLAIASAMNGINENDTLYVATQAGLKPGDIFPNQTYVHVYDATDAENIRLLYYLPAGLWHFDVAKSGNRLFIASEWYGIKTLDISDLANPIDLGNTLTGGWNTDADAFGDLLITANEGNGFKLWDISDIKNPTLAAENHNGTFCHRIRFSADGNYIFAVYSTGKGLRVFETATLAQIDSLDELIGTGKMLLWEDRIFIKQKLLFGKEQLNIINVADPFSVEIERSEKMDINDMAIENGKLFLVNDDDILIYDISAHRFEQIFAENLPSAEKAKLVAVNRDTIFVCRENGSITELARYLLQQSGNTFSLIEDGAVELGNGTPQALAADEFGCYLAYTKYGLIAMDKSFNGDFGYYQTGLDFKNFEDKFGVTSLFCKNGYIFLCEYFAQTSILANHDIFTDISEPQPIALVPQNFKLHPNPASENSVIEFSLPAATRLSIKIYNIRGQEIATLAEKHFTGGHHVLPMKIHGLANGVYFIRFRGENFSRIFKFIVLR